MNRRWSNRLRIILVIRTTNATKTIHCGLTDLLYELTLFDEDCYAVEWFVLDRETKYELDKRFLERIIGLLTHKYVNNLVEELESLEMYKITQENTVISDVYAYIMEWFKHKYRSNKQ